MRLDLGGDDSLAPPSPPPLIVSVILPMDRKPGDTIMIQPPGAVQCQVVVPEGVVPGQAFQVQLPGSIFASAAATAPAQAPTWAPPPPAARPDPEAAGLLGNIITADSNPWVTSKAERMRAKFGDGVPSVNLRGSSEQQKLQQLERDLAQFKTERGMGGRTLAGGLADEGVADEDVPLVQKVQSAGLKTTLSLPTQPLP